MNDDWVYAINREMTSSIANIENAVVIDILPFGLLRHEVKTIIEALIRHERISTE